MYPFYQKYWTASFFASLLSSIMIPSNYQGEAGVEAQGKSSMVLKEKNDPADEEEQHKGDWRRARIQ